MHEFGLAESALDLAITEAQRQGAVRIHQITMRIGAHSGVVPEAFRFAFEALVDGTMAQGARLVIEEVPLTCYCTKCGKEFRPPAFSYRCPECHEQSKEIRAGQEMNLASLEVS